MPLELWQHEVRRSWRLWLALAAGLVLFAWLEVLIYPQIRASFTQMLKVVPSFARPLVALRGGMESFEGEVAMAFTHPVLLALLASWPLGRAAGAIAGEIEHETLGWMLSYPLGRNAFLGTKALVMLIGTWSLALAFSSTLFLAARLSHLPHAAWPGYAWTAGMAGLLYSAFGAWTLWASAASSETGQALRVGLGLLLGSYLWNYACQLYGPLKAWGWISLFHYFEPRQLLTGASGPGSDMAVLAAVTIVGLVGAFWTFQRRDLSI